MGYRIVTLVRIELDDAVPRPEVDLVLSGSTEGWNEAALGACPPAVQRVLRVWPGPLATMFRPAPASASAADGGGLLSPGTLSAHWDMHDEEWAGQLGITIEFWLLAMQSRTLLPRPPGESVLGVRYDPNGAVTELRANSDGVVHVRVDGPWADRDVTVSTISWDEVHAYLDD